MSDNPSAFCGMERKKGQRKERKNDSTDPVMVILCGTKGTSFVFPLYFVSLVLVVPAM